MSITLKLDGLHCGNCVKSVEKALNAVEGVKSGRNFRTTTSDCGRFC
ncbi:cation transport ATPase [Actinobacillus ureae]|uniref:HMA domain-containing protein n=1 Tax=Actinobacillus ureae ATCC 25976 TaxID=887324 RepID=E8KFC8_9PAST|nr:hypothetical protein HMPREF0027_0545 [Actinobacillus ureae ATCC 25976]SUT85536.1 cation transport ATPase [Actinobacillus ureae]SUU42975.1 cation transport ATPase [Actinobacillus ureae]